MPKLSRGMAALGRITGLSREFLRTGATLNRRYHAGTLNFDGLGSHKTNGRAIPEADKQVVRDFWMSDAITRQSPNTKDVRKMTDHTDPENPTKTNVTKRWKEESHSVIFAMFKEKVRLFFRHRRPYRDTSPVLRSLNFLLTGLLTGCVIMVGGMVGRSTQISSACCARSST